MGKRGPAPKPTHLKILEGTARPDRMNAREPIPPSKAPTCPTWLSEEARRVWRRMAPELHARGVLTEWDREAFIVLCEAIAQHRQACQLVTGSNVLVRGDRGLVKNPALQVVRDTAQTIRAYAQEFGLTPSARTGVSALDVRDLTDGLLD